MPIITGPNISITRSENSPTFTNEFYKKRGLAIAAVHEDAIKESRKLNPEISQTGADGIPIRDEVEMEMIPG